jgi:hypothetical protein
MLEYEDIQHILLARAPALTGRYEFLSFRNAACGRTWLSAILEKVHSAAEVRASVEKDNRWVTVAFTWNGLCALGVGEVSLATFPEEFKQGMVARAEMLGDIGENHPNNWVGGLARPDLHAIAILFARDAAERGRCRAEHDKLVARCEGIEVISTLDLEATPPFDYAHDHFGYRDRLSQPVIEGTGEVPTPGSGAPLKPGEFILGYPDESRRSAGFIHFSIERWCKGDGQMPPWLIPMLYVTGSIVCGFTLPRIEQAYFAAYKLGLSVASTQAFLSAAASGMMALTGIVFAIGMVMVQFSAIAYSPRLALWLLHDRTLFHALGVFSTTFIYALSTLAWVDREGSGTVPLFSNMLVLVLLIASMFLFSLLVQRLNDLHQAPGVIPTCQNH